MKQLFFILSIIICSFIQAQTPNLYRNPERVYLDSKEEHEGASTWLMIKASDAKETAEQISQIDYQTKEWMPAIVPGTVLNSLVWNKILVQN